MIRSLQALFFVLACVAASTASAQLASVRHVNDTVGILSEGKKAEIENRLVAFEEKTSIEVCVLLIRSFAADDLDRYAAAMFDDWKIGRMKGRDNGILLVATAKEGNVSIRFGKDLEPARNKQHADLIADLVSRELKRDQVPQAMDRASRLLCLDWNALASAKTAGAAASVGMFGFEPDTNDPRAKDPLFWLAIGTPTLMVIAITYYASVRKVTTDSVPVRVAEGHALSRSYGDVMSESARLARERLGET